MNITTRRSQAVAGPPAEVERELILIEMALREQLKRLDAVRALINGQAEPAACISIESPSPLPPQADLLYGVPAIAAYLGLSDKQVRHRAEAGDLPTFKIGGTVCARRSSLTVWLAGLEADALQGGGA